nr:tape measure protein [Bifidobacterium biavatii]
MSVRITGNADEAARAFEKTTSKAAAFGSFMGGAALKGVTALWDTIKNFSADVMDMSDSTDKFKNTMSFAGLDTSAVEKATAATRKYADDTVYDLTTIQNTTAQLAANGIGNYTELTEAAGNLNAVAGGNSDTFKSVAMVLTQTAGAGKLTTENWNQLADAIPGASGKLQEALKEAGAYTGNFRDAMADGQITADEFNNALVKLGMSDVAKEAATSTQTMEGALGNLEASITGGLTDAFDLIKPAVTGSIGWAAEKIADYAKTGTDNMKGFADGLSNTSAFQSAKTMFEKTAGAVKAVGGAFQDIVSVIAPGVQGLSDAQGVGQTTGDVFADVADAVGWVADKVKAFGDWVSANADPVTAGLVGIGTGLAVFKAATLITAAKTAMEGFSTAAALAAAKQELLNLVMSANPLLLVISLIAGVVAALVWFCTQTETGRRLWGEVTQFFADCMAKIKGLFDKLPQWASDAWTNAKNSAKAAVDGIAGFFGGLRDQVLGVFDSIISGIKKSFDWASSLWDKITGAKKEASGLSAQNYSAEPSALYGAAPVAVAAMRAVPVADRLRAVPAVQYASAGSAYARPVSQTFQITVNGVLDGEDAARKIRRVLKDYERKRG